MDVGATRPESLPSAWRQKADWLRRYAPEVAAAFEQCAKDLEAALNTAASELLTLQEAAQVSGYSADHLGRLIREGRLQNHGRPRAPRLRRAELPQKTPTVAHARPIAQLLGAAPRQVAQAVASSHRGDR